MQRFHHARQAMQVSDSRSSVSRVLQELIAQMLPSELSVLPDAVGPLLTADPASVPASALDLTRIELYFSGDPEAGSLLRDIAQVYVMASNRIATLDAKAKLFTVPT